MPDQLLDVLVQVNKCSVDVTHDCYILPERLSLMLVQLQSPSSDHCPWMLVLLPSEPCCMLLIQIHRCPNQSQRRMRHHSGSLSIHRCREMCAGAAYREVIVELNATSANGSNTCNIGSNICWHNTCIRKPGLCE